MAEKVTGIFITNYMSEQEHKEYMGWFEWFCFNYYITQVGRDSLMEMGFEDELFPPYLPVEYPETDIDSIELTWDHAPLPESTKAAKPIYFF